MKYKPKSPERIQAPVKTQLNDNKKRMKVSTAVIDPRRETILEHPEEIETITNDNQSDS